MIRTERPRGSGRWRVSRALCRLVVAASLLSGCASLGLSPTRGAEAEAERARREKLEEANRRLEKTNQQLERERRALQESLKKETAPRAADEELARLRLLLLERDAQLKALTQKLDSAILEVVRALAKLRSLESKAEAATNLAEAEIAVRMLGQGPPAPDKDPEVAQAEQLVKLGAEEFRKDNYSGALYLSSQAKSLIRGGQARSLGSDTMPKVDGEVPFSLPLPLRLVARGQVRQGPGPSFTVTFVLPPGAPVIGHSYKGLWVRIRGDDGRSGWVFYDAVGQR